MPKMKHLLRKLHIGGSMNEHQRLGETPSVIRPEPTTNSSVSSSWGSTSTPDSPSLGTMERFGAVASVVDQSSVNFNLLEEEFQVELAMAISASDPAVREDPESAQIDAAKRMSLGCFPSVSDTHALVELLSLQYWSYNVIHYDEKVLDGFYDIRCTTSNSGTQGKMPLLVDLQATSVSSDVNYDAILVNGFVDLELQQLERQVHTISIDCRDSNDWLIFSGLIQKIANIVVNRMGGPVDDTEEIFRRWNTRSYELRSSLKTNVLPLGLLDIGLSRHRALLFKVLADWINLPCMLVKGSYYTGTDDGAMNLIKVDGGSEYIIDLMGAPGTLIPSEPSGCQLLNSGFGDVRIKEMPISELTEEILSNCVKAAEISNLMSMEASFSEGSKTMKDDRNSAETHSGIDDGFRYLSKLQHNSDKTLGAYGKRSFANEKKVKNVSKYVISAAKNPEFAQKLHAVLLESGTSPPPDFLTDITSLGPVQTKMQQQIHSVNGKDVDVFQCQSRELSATDGLTLASNVMESFDNVIYERKQKQSSERLVEQLRETDSCFGNHEVSLQCCTTSEKFTPLGTGIYKQIQVDTHQEYIAEPSMTANTSPCQRQHEMAWSVNNKITDKNESFPYKNEAKESENMKTMGISGLHIACVGHSERVGAVLSDVAEWEIPWENINIGERIGIGSYGEVYRADWNSTEVAVKKFLNQDLSGDASTELKSEVEIMLRLRHPNVVLFMGAVTRGPHFSILTEFLPRGSLFGLLHRSNYQLKEKRRLRMALDVAKGMNYLHTSHPTVVHRDLKSPNLLVDKNWVVKVCDFGLSRIKLHTFLSSNSTAGTPEWMAPEVLRNEPANEKCDVYSFGVILWELATCSIPWKGLNPMQVVGAVGFQDRQLEIPDDVDPVVAQIILDCLRSETHLRPSFSQLMLRLRRLQRLVVDC